MLKDAGVNSLKHCVFTLSLREEKVRYMQVLEAHLPYTHTHTHTHTHSSSLTWRDIQYLTAYTSDPTPLRPHGEWTTNGGGLLVSHQFGFGAVDAEAMVTRARHWITVPEQSTCTVTPSITSG